MRKYGAARWRRQAEFSAWLGVVYIRYPLLC
jgi:hypothetical protein